MTEHSNLTSERWSRFSLTQQILQIGAEMHRGMSSFKPEHAASLTASYERALRLTDLTVQVGARDGLRRELLRWRDVVAELCLRDQPDPATHRLALRVLLQLNAEAAEQIPLLGL